MLTSGKAKSGLRYANDTRGLFCHCILGLFCLYSRSILTLVHTSGMSSVSRSLLLRNWSIYRSLLTLVHTSGPRGVRLGNYAKLVKTNGKAPVCFLFYFFILFCWATTPTLAKTNARLRYIEKPLYREYVL